LFFHERSISPILQEMQALLAQPMVQDAMDSVQELPTMSMNFFFYCLNCEDLVVSFTRLNKHVLIIKPAYIFCYNCPLIGDNLTDFFFLS
jgi:hypothetical protein